MQQALLERFEKAGVSETWNLGPAIHHVVMIGGNNMLPYIDLMDAYNENEGRGIFSGLLISPSHLLKCRGLFETLRFVDSGALASRISRCDTWLVEGGMHVRRFPTIEGILFRNRQDSSRCLTVPRFEGMRVLSGDRQSAPYGENDPHPLEQGMQALWLSCANSSFPELYEVIRLDWKRYRWWNSASAVSPAFTEYIFSQLLVALGRDLPSRDFRQRIRSMDTLASLRTEVTQEDRDNLGISW